MHRPTLILIAAGLLLCVGILWWSTEVRSSASRLERIQVAAQTLSPRLRDYQVLWQDLASSPPNGSPVHGRISSPYGMRLHPRYQRWKQHHGVDIAVEVGTPVMVTADGWVSRIANDPDGWGLFMDVLHPGSGYLTRYAHLSVVHVPVGTPVRRGRVIAETGNSGNSVGAHLHYEVRLRSGESVDPLTIQVP